MMNVERRGVFRAVRYGFCITVQVPHWGTRAERVGGARPAIAGPRRIIFEPFLELASEPLTRKILVASFASLD